MKENYAGIRKELRLVFSIVTFFLLCSGLNFLNAAENVPALLKIAGGVIVVLFIGTLGDEEPVKES